jgi:8-oxo-dGTP pyrophosphatase MutT (NUDIX family)
MFDEFPYYSIIESLANQLPRRNDGHIDYTHAKKAAVITIFIRRKNKILLLKRSNKVLTYKGKWNTVAGYLDELVPIKDKIIEELYEELSILKKDIEMISIGDYYEFYDTNIKRIWIIFPVLITLNKTPDIRLDWEHTDYRWINLDEIEQYDTVPNLNKSLQQF